MNGKYKYVAVIGIDGMGGFNRNTPTPCMDRIFAHGATTYKALSMPPTISAQNWGAMLLGVNPVVHGLTNSIVGNKRYENKAFPSVFYRIRQAMPDAYLTSVSNWEPINFGIIEEGIGVSKATADNDRELLPIILDEIAKKPVFMFVQFDDVDGAGHHFGYGTEGHLDKITETDGYVGELFSAYGKAGIIDETLFIVIADHGGENHSHGGYTDGEKYIFLGASGKGVRNGEIKVAYTKDIAAIVLSALGLELPQYELNGFSSQLPQGIFEDTCEYIIPEEKVCVFTPRPTPDFNSPKGLSDFVSPEKLELAVFFDESMEDATGKHTPETRGAIKYYNGGVTGSFAEVGLTGNAVYNTVKIGSNSFSVGFWAKIDSSLYGSPVVCSDKDWGSERSGGKGFAVAFRSADTMLSLADGNDNSEEYIVPFPMECVSGWIHTLMVVDKEKKEYRCYCNFTHQLTFELEDCLLCDLDSMIFALGDDVSGRYNSKENESLLCLDDFLLFNRALSEEEISRLAEYYA